MRKWHMLTVAYRTSQWGFTVLKEAKDRKALHNYTKNKIFCPNIRCLHLIIDFRHCFQNLWGNFNIPMWTIFAEWCNVGFWKVHNSAGFHRMKPKEMAALSKLLLLLANGGAAVYKVPWLGVAAGVKATEERPRKIRVDHERAEWKHEKRHSQHLTFWWFCSSRLYVASVNSSCQASLRY